MVFYFVSENEVIELTPRIPDNFMVKNGFENDTMKRICVSKSISGCLTALSSNIKGKNFYVYKIESKHFIKPNSNNVPDVNLTDEYWILENIKPKLYCKINVGSTIENVGMLLYKIGNSTYELFKWEYKITKLI